MESSRDDQLAATLRALAPTPRPAFAAELDERAAAGFPRRSALGGSPLAGFFAHLRAMPPRRALLPACAVGLTAIVAATAVVATTESGPGPTNRDVVASVGGQDSADATRGTSAKPTHLTPNGLLGYSPPRSSSPFPNGGRVSRYGAEGSPSYGANSSGAASTTAGSGTSAQRAGETGPYTSQAGHRDVERSAEMVLGAEPAEVGDDAAKVFEAVHAYDGIVLKSSIANGSEGGAGAQFDLLIPSAKLGDALAAFSGIAEVRSRHEATDDITAPTVGVSERLRDSTAKIEGLLAQLAGAETDGEREAVEAELQTERRHAASLRSRLTALQRRANFSRVSLRIETGGSAAGSSGGSWGIDDALGDAGHILAIAAGATIVGLAILGPLALLALLIWLADRVRVRRGRERALG